VWQTGNGVAAGLTNRRPRPKQHAHARVLCALLIISSQSTTARWDERVYDLNAWQLPRRPLNATADGEPFEPGPLRGQTRLPDDLVGSDKAFVPLDSVGGCTTLVRADVHREGALFTTYYAVGTTWGREGRDGLESEGGFWRLKVGLRLGGRGRSGVGNVIIRGPNAPLKPHPPANGTAGLCYVARSFGRSCWLATRLVTYHQSYWIKQP
jgi:hypothetical protein